MTITKASDKTLGATQFPHHLLFTKNTTYAFLVVCLLSSVSRFAQSTTARMDGGREWRRRQSERHYSLICSVAQGQLCQPNHNRIASSTNLPRHFYHFFFCKKPKNNFLFTTSLSFLKQQEHPTEKLSYYFENNKQWNYPNVTQRQLQKIKGKVWNVEIRAL